jgi:hypothetical protein
MRRKVVCRFRRFVSPGMLAGERDSSPTNADERRGLKVLVAVISGLAT